MEEEEANKILEEHRAKEENFYFVSVYNFTML